MKNLKEITLPIFLELDCKNIKEVNSLIENVLALAVSHNIKSKVSLENIQTHPHYNNSAVVVFSVAINPVKGNDSDFIGFLQEVFANFYQNHPRFSEPI